jgi:hypothetical protein
MAAIKSSLIKNWFVLSSAALGAYLACPFGGGWQTFATKPIDQPIDLAA